MCSFLYNFFHNKKEHVSNNNLKFYVQTYDTVTTVYSNFYRIFGCTIYRYRIKVCSLIKVTPCTALKITLNLNLKNSIFQICKKSKIYFFILYSRELNRFLQLESFSLLTSLILLTVCQKVWISFSKSASFKFLHTNQLPIDTLNSITQGFNGDYKTKLKLHHFNYTSISQYQFPKHSYFTNLKQTEILGQHVTDKTANCAILMLFFLSGTC